MTLQNHLTPAKLKNRLGILALFGLDFLALFLLFHASVFIRGYILPRFFSELPDYQYNFGDYWWMFAVWLVIMLYKEGYSRRFAGWDEVKFLWKSAFLSTIVILTMLFMMKRGQQYSRVLVITMFAMVVMLLPLIRLRVKRFLYAMGLMRRKLLIVGSGEAARNAYAAINGEPNLGYEIGGFIDDTQKEEKIDCHKVHRGIHKIERYINSAGIHDVIVAKPELDKDTLAKLINTIQHKAENTLYIPDLTGLAVSGTELRHFFREQTMIIGIKNNLAQPVIYITKRTIDYAISLLISPFLIVPGIIIAAIIRITTKNSAIYKQERHGKGGKIFLCYKFQTMYPDADEKLKEILEKDPDARQEWLKFSKLKNDPRITPIGRFLRGTSLDELPQIINVFKGEMSLVGPRPLPHEAMERYPKQEAPFYYLVPPGITGLWQVSGRSNTSFDYHASLNSCYVKNWDLWLDIMILFKTVDVVLSREGAH